MSWVLMLFACGGSETDPVQPSGPPDIVMVVVDTLRADHTSMYGYARDTTPRITEFAEDAVRFERAYAASPWTKPSITTLLTSTLPRDHGVVQWEHVQDEDLVSMSTHLKSQGYATQAYVSHHALAPKHNRFHLGFDVYDTSVFGGDRGSAHKISSAREVTDQAIAGWKAHKADHPDQPLFLWVHYFDPHDAYLRHDDFDYGKRPVDRYDSEIAYTDHHIGRLLDVLGDEPLIALTADHGEEFKDHGGLKHTLTLYDEVLRVPLLIRGPGIKRNVLKRPVGLIDLAPTLLRVADLPVPESFVGQALPSDGFGRIDVPRNRPIYVETRRLADKRGVVSGRWKLIHDAAADQWELYDLRTDPEERDNVIDTTDHPHVSKMRDLLVHYDRIPVHRVTRHDDPEYRALLEELGYLEGDVEPTEEPVRSPSSPSE